ncbi:MAG: hypothetical protein RID23_16325 [Roseovarius sp.]
MPNLANRVHKLERASSKGLLIFIVEEFRNDGPLYAGAYVGGEYLEREPDESSSDFAVRANPNQSASVDLEADSFQL